MAISMRPSGRIDPVTASLLQRAQSTAPIAHPMQGIAQLAQALAARNRMASEQEQRAQMAQALGANQGDPNALVQALTGMRGNPQAQDLASQIALSRALQGPAERKTVKDANGFLRDLETGERVFPDVELAEKLTSGQRDLIGEGLKPGTQEFQKALRDRRMKSGVSVSVDARGKLEDKFESTSGTEMAKLFTQDYADMNTAKRRAPANIARIRRAKQLSKKLDSGPTFESRVFMKGLAKSMGVDIDAAGFKDDVAEAEAFRSISMDFVMELISQTKGSISNAEMQKFAEASASLRNTKEGNQLILEFAEKAERNKIKIGRLADEYVRNNGGRLDVGFNKIRDEFFEKNAIIDADFEKRIDAEVDARDQIFPLRDTAEAGESGLLVDPETGQRRPASQIPASDLIKELQRFGMDVRQ